MRIGGLQKFSLLDYPDKISAIVFTQGCNFRCPFCHNPSLIPFLSSEQVLESDVQNEKTQTQEVYSSEISEKDLLSFLSTRRRQLDGVCITGGEPLLQKYLPEFIHQVRQLGFLVKLDTNGSFPERLEQLIQENMIDYIAMDIKNAPERYTETIGIEKQSLDPVMKSVDLIRNSNIDYEFRTTLVREFHSRQDIQAIGQWLQGSRKYYLQNFRHSDNLLTSLPLHSFTSEELIEFQNVVLPYFDLVEIRE